MKELISQFTLEIIVVAGAAIAGTVYGLRKLMMAYRTRAPRQPGRGGTMTAAVQRCVHVATRVRPVLIGACWYGAVVGLTWLAVAPVLRDPRLCILDCANVYRSYSAVRWLQPATWLNVDNDPTSVRPGEVLVHLPAYWSLNPAAQYWYLNGVVLTGMMLALFFVLQRTSGSRLLAAVAVAACLSAPSFVENFYTLGKCEPFMAAGAIGVSWLLYMLLFRQPAPRGAWWLILVPLGVYCALLAVTVKETAVAFVGVYAAGLVCLVWAAPLPLSSGLRRTAWLSALIAAGFFLLVYCFLHIPETYNQGETAVYSLHPRNLQRGVIYIGLHYLRTAPHAVLALAMLLLTLPQLSMLRRDAIGRVRLAWMLFFWLMWLGMLAIYIPWSSPQLRYFYPSTSALYAAIVLTISLALYAARRAQTTKLLWAQRALAALALVLMAAHAVFTIQVGHRSEGRARQQFDAVYDEMFKFVARHTPRGGTAYFIYDNRYEEPQYNTRFGLPLFYQRDDIACVFPDTFWDFAAPGLVVVADSDFPYNPNRMPAHEYGAALFHERMKASLPLRVVTNIVCEVPMWYTEARAHRGVQHASRSGIPDFRRLLRGTYRFGWVIYAFAPHQPRANLIRNENFALGMRHWELWGAADREPQSVTISNHAARIANPNGALRGIKQSLSTVLSSGYVYRISATARCIGVSNPGAILGARVAVHLPPQPESELTWLSRRTEWWRQSTVFTNMVTGEPIILVHLGYGGVISTAEFTDVVLEQIEP